MGAESEETQQQIATELGTRLEEMTHAISLTAEVQRIMQ